MPLVIDFEELGFIMRIFREVEVTILTFWAGFVGLGRVSRPRVAVEERRS